MENIVDAVDEITKVISILDFLSNETRETGLSFILDGCAEDLKNAYSLIQSGFEVIDVPEGPEA